MERLSVEATKSPKNLADRSRSRAVGDSVLVGEMDVTESTPRTDSAAEDVVGHAWRAHGQTALRLAAALVGPSDAHDIVTTAFLRVIAQPEWQQIDKLRAYLMRAVRNEAQNLYRSRRRRWQRDLAAVGQEASGDEPADLDVHRALSRLSLRQRSVLYLAYWEDMTEAAIAAELDLSRGTVHRDIRRARDQLRKALT